MENDINDSKVKLLKLVVTCKCSAKLRKCILQQTEEIIRS